MFFSGIADEAGDPIAVQIKAHKELGWHHIEMRNVSGVSFTDLCDRTFEEVVEQLGQAGLAVSCFAAQLCNWARPITKHPDIDRDELARAIPRMHRLGCEFIRTMSYPNAGWPEEDWKAEVIARLKVLAEMAADGGVTLVHENCNGWGGLGPEQTLELLERVNCPAMKLVWDTGNPVAHGQNSWDYYDAVKEHVVYVHIKDGIMKDGKTTFTLPGEGQGYVKETIQDLRRRKYAGGVSIEPHVAAIVHEGKAASQATSAYEKYVEYGQHLMKLVAKIH